MNNPLISVVIPVYQAAKTIERCISSIICSKAEIEIVCIDDGSTDNSLAILDKLASTDARLRVIHQENAGAGAARNTGICEAVGQYLMFCDADDVYQNDTIDYIVDDIEKYDPDYIVFHRKTIKNDGSIQYWGTNKETLENLSCSWSEYLNQYFNVRQHGAGVVTKVFKKEIVNRNNIVFPKYKFSEDLSFILSYVVHSKIFIEDYRAYYIQYQSSASICMSSYSNYFDLNTAWMKDFIELHPGQSLDIMPFLSTKFYEDLIWSITRILRKIDIVDYMSKKQACLDIFNKSMVHIWLPRFLKHGSPAKRDKKNCSMILNNSYWRFVIINFYIPELKGKVNKSIIGTFLRK